MSYQHKDNSGSLFVNDKKKSPNHPDRTGSALIDGVEYYVSGWIKKDKNGTPFMSMAFKPKDEGGSRKQEAEADDAFF